MAGEGEQGAQARPSDAIADAHACIVALHGVHAAAQHARAAVELHPSSETVSSTSTTTVGRVLMQVKHGDEGPAEGLESPLTE